MPQARRQPMTFEQFLDWERRQERKYEFVDGDVIAMAGASEAMASSNSPPSASR
jgi:Uma2 family endonuclease